MVLSNVCQVISLAGLTWQMHVYTHCKQKKLFKVPWCYELVLCIIENVLYIKVVIIDYRSSSNYSQLP